MTTCRRDAYILLRKLRRTRDEISKYVRYNVRPPMFATNPNLYELAWKFHTLPIPLGREVLHMAEYYSGIRLFR